jgi:hypothetical protein
MNSYKHRNTHPGAGGTGGGSMRKGRASSTGIQTASFRLPFRPESDDHLAAKIFTNITRIWASPGAGSMTPWPTDATGPPTLAPPSPETAAGTTRAGPQEYPQDCSVPHGSPGRPPMAVPLRDMRMGRWIPSVRLNPIIRWRPAGKYSPTKGTKMDRDPLPGDHPGIERVSTGVLPPDTDVQALITAGY